MANRKINVELLAKRLAALEMDVEELTTIKSEQLDRRLQKMEDKLYNVKTMLTSREAAEFLGITLSMLYKLTSRMEIPHYKPHGKMVYFDKEELEEWMRTNHIKVMHRPNDNTL